MKIAVTAPSARIEPSVASQVKAIAAAQFGARAPDIAFHPQCFLEAGHFAGTDQQRLDGFLEVANDPSVDAVWFARGGYGSNRIASAALERLGPEAREKIYLGFSDAGFLLAGLYKAGFERLAHGPMPSNLAWPDSEPAIRRALSFLVDADASTLEPSLSAETAPTAAFNLTVFAHLIGTPLEPDLSGHVLMLEDVSEYLYRIDRAMFQISERPFFEKLAGLRLGRISDVPENDRPFGQTAEEIARAWCARKGVAFLGGCDIGHDAENKVAPFGRWRGG